ncbi:hypothetical protein EHS13_06900 [Paenibacillus psychroresistens]|uniref:Serine protease n=2 Tax=Paenibacillus psychroresistens TaxID=1778678 RepID=A0A6B8RGI5_9BACL|nr:hypothetical protein EHS13_06900 [Paenibacillus psychroresistens]
MFKKFVVFCMLVFGVWVAVISLKPVLVNAEEEPMFLTNEHKVYVEGEVIVKFKTNLNSGQSLSLTRDNNLSLKAVIPLDNESVQLLKINSTENVNSVVTSLIDSGLVELAQPNYLYYTDSVPSNNDAKFLELWGLNNNGQSIQGESGIDDIDLDAPEAWEYTNDLNEVIVAVIDTGVDINHPDLIGRTVQGWDFLHDDSSVYDEGDGDYHGTHVAGTIAAAADSIGVRGVASNVKIMPLKFIGPKGGSTLDAIDAIHYAKEYGAQVINASWGGADGGYDELLNQAIEDSGIVFVAAAGNDSSNNDIIHKSPTNLPAANIISVAAIDNKGQLAYFSNYGLENVDVGAPGVNILSTFPKFGQTNYSEAYAYLSGTSMAAPHVTGIAAALLGQKHLSTVETIALIKESGVTLSSLQGKTSSGKMANLNNAIATQVSKPFIKLTSNKAGESSDYQLTFQLSSYGKLLKGEHITLNFPMDAWPYPFPPTPPSQPGFPPAAPTNEYSFKINGLTSSVSQAEFFSSDAGSGPTPTPTPSPEPGNGSGTGPSTPPPSGGGSIETGVFSVTIELQEDTPSASIVEIEVLNIINPNAGTYAVSVSTSVDPKLVNSNLYAITNGLSAAPIVDFANTGVTATTASFNWTAAEGASSVSIQQSLLGMDWSEATTLIPITANATGATVTGLSPDEKYQFKLVVTGGSNAGESNSIGLYTSELLKPTMAIAQNNKTIVLYYNNPVELLTSQNVLNYSINHNVQVTKAVRQSEPNKVILTTSTLNAGLYEITIDNVTDLGGGVVNPLENSVYFAGINSGETGPITSFMSTGKTADTASFSWIAPSNADSILIQESTDGTHWSTATTLAPISTIGTDSATVIDLAVNTKYQFKLVVIGGSSAGDSNVVSLTTLLADPFSVTAAVAWTNTTVELTFNKPLDPLTAQFIANYSITELYGAKAKLSVISAVMQMDPKKVILTTVSPSKSGAIYKVTIGNVKDSAGELINSGHNSIVFIGNGFLANPLLTSAIVEGKQITLTYNQPLDESSIPSPKDFKVFIDNNPQSTVKVESVALSSFEVILTLYTEILESQAVSLNYQKDETPIRDVLGQSAANLINQLIINILGAPEIVRADPITNTTVMLTFNEALDKVSTENIGNYTIDNGLTVLKAELQQDPAKVKLTTNYQSVGTLYHVIVFNVKDLSGKLISSDHRVTSFAGEEADTIAPAISTELSAAPGDASVTLNWKANNEDDLAGYNVYVNGIKHNIGILTANTYSVGLLINGQSYSFTVTSVDISGNESIPSEVVTASPVEALPEQPGPEEQPEQPGQPGPLFVSPDITPPAKPTGLNAQAGDSEIVLQWTVNDEPDLGGYNIYQNGARLNTVTVTGSTYTVKPLTNGTGYTFQISAVDKSANESAHSLEATATPELVFKVNPAGLSYQLLSYQPVDSAVFAKALEQLEAKKLHILTLLLPKAETDASIKLLVADLYLIAKQIPNAVIEIKSAKNSFLLPVKLIDFEALEDKFGAAAFHNLLLVVSMEKVDQASEDKFTLALGDKGSLVSPIIKFTTSFEGDGKQELLTDFNGKYVSRTFEMDEQTNPNELTVVTLDEATGQLAFVPALFQTDEGKTIVTLKSPHNSLYGVVRTPHKFADLSNHWAQMEIDLLADKGLIKGVTAEKFNPNTSVTRAEFTVMLARALGLREDKQAALKLSDITEDSWYAGGVGAAIKAGVVSGYKNNTFGANEKITREQMAVMLGNALSYLQASVNIRERQDIILSELADQHAISKWAVPFVAELLETGIVKGRDDHSFAPQEYASRAEAASMLVRFLQFIAFIN